MDPNVKKKTRTETEPSIEENDDHNTSLIPSHIVDQASQRLFLVSIFVLLQCWKIYDVIVLKSDLLSTSSLTPPLNNFTFVLKYAIVDGSFLWLLPILNIPYLTFSPFQTLVMTLILNGLTFFLISDVTVPFISTFIMPIWKTFFSKKELTIVGDSVSTKHVIDINSHFKGKYTIHYLPDSSAKFNPFHFDKICLNPEINSLIQMPIEFNTTTEIGLLQIQHVTPSNEIKYINYTHNTLNKLLKKDYSYLSQFQDYIRNDRRIFYVEVPIKSPGLYKINKVTDNKGINIRTYKSDFVVSYCPSAEFIYPPNFNADKNFKCIGSDNEDLRLPLVNLFGVFPLTVLFETRLNGKRYSSFNSTLGNSAPSMKKDLSWLEANSVTRNIIEQELLRNPEILSKADAGDLEFRLAEIIDSMGNSKRYNPSSKDKDVWFEIKLKKIPKLQLTDTDSQQPLLVNGSKTLSVDVNEDFKESDFPLRVDIRYKNTKDDLLSYNFSKTFKDFQELSQGIHIDKAGIYFLTSAQNRFCPCEISETKGLTVALTSPPSVEIDAEPIVDKCVGMTGYKFSFDLKGKQPFHIQYHVFQNLSNGILRPVHNERGLTTRVLKTLDKKYKFEYRPPAEGNYVIVFNTLKDVNYYSRPILLDERKHTYSTYFKQRSKVSFFESNDELQKIIKTCLGDSVTIPLYFKGNSPFSFNYDIINIDTSEKLTNSVRVSNVSFYRIETPSFSKGGNYEIKLSQLKDSLSCDVDFDKRESVIIRTRSDIPEVSINSKATDMKIVEGDAFEIPLIFKSSVGRTPFDQLEYTVTDMHNRTHKKLRVLKNLKSFRVKEEGIYSLSSFSNDGCPGKIVNQEKSIAVSYYARPNLTIIAENVLQQHSDEGFTHLKPTCQNCENQIKLLLEGDKPFVIDYHIKLPNDKIEARSMTVNDHSISINLPTSQSGRYEHYFKGVYDKLYTKEKSAKLTPTRFPAVRYDIKPSPNANFDKKYQFLQICETNLKQLDSPIYKIPINLVGEYPFTINASLTHESTGQSHSFIIENTQEPFLNLLDVAKTMNVGEHILTINELTDSNGCSRSQFSPLNNFVFSITEVPNISKLSKKHYYCVGDHITYNMSGIPPFTVYYKFNNRLQKAESGYRFQRLASKPGELSIVALSDSSANQCLVNFTQSVDKFEELKLKVYDLPSVEVNQGNYIVQDIHEGDQTEIKFSFTGVPPFKLTYIRTNEQIDHKDKKNSKKEVQVVESKTVEDIWDYEYTVLASLEGTYEAVEVQDAYCIAKKEI